MFVVGLRNAVAKKWPRQKFGRDAEFYVFPNTERLLIAITC